MIRKSLMIIAMSDRMTTDFIQRRVNEICKRNNICTTVDKPLDMLQKVNVSITGKQSHKQT